MSFSRKLYSKIYNNPILLFFKNCWKFRKDLSNFREYDYRYNLDLFLSSLKITRDFMLSKEAVSLDSLENSREIQKFIDLISRHDNAAEFVEKELGYKLSRTAYITSDDREFIKRVEMIEINSWNDAFNHLRDRLRHWWD